MTFSNVLPRINREKQFFWDINTQRNPRETDIISKNKKVDFPVIEKTTTIFLKKWNLIFIERN